MILPYLARLVCLALACFFLVHLALASGVSILAPWILSVANRMHPRFAAGVLFCARMFPLAGAVLAVAGMCVPSYLWLEPEGPVEEVGRLCLGAAALAVAICGVSIGRGLRAVALSIRFERDSKHFGRETWFAGETTPVVVVDGAAGLLALTGILRPRLVISQEALSVLSAGQLAAALGHERMHKTSRDNLKRLLLLVAPDILPFRSPLANGLKALVRGWTRSTELAADDGAVGGDSRRSVLLAEALVRVARLGSATLQSPLMTSLVAEDCDLEARVERLLGPAPGNERPAARGPVLAAATALVAGFFLLAGFAAPASLQLAHRLLEHLVR